MRFEDGGRKSEVGGLKSDERQISTKYNAGSP